MAKLTINFQDDIKFNRDLDAICEFLNKPDMETKQNFVEKLLKEHFKKLSKEYRMAKAIGNLTIED